MQDTGTASANETAAGRAALRRAAAPADPSNPFIRDIEPFLYGRPITYVDVGAYQGAVLEELLNSSIRLRDVHLVEPNPATFRALEAKVAELAPAAPVTCHNVAVSDRPGVVAMRDRRDMTHVIGPAADEGERAASPTVFEANAVTLDEMARAAGLAHIALLKIDVEGHELAALQGARQLLENESVDVVYVEAGMDPDSTQQTYYRAIEDVLRGHGYRLFGIYEQTNEWLDDSPLLRRVNLAFMSARFVADNPYRLSRELFDLRTRLADAETALAEEEARSEKLERQAASHERLQGELAGRDRRIAELETTLAEKEAEAATLARQLEGRDGQVAKLEAALAEKEAEAATLAGRVEDRDGEGARLEAALQDRFREIAALTGQLEGHAGEAAKLEAALKTANARAQKFKVQHENLKNSFSWKVTAPVRGIGRLAGGGGKKA